MTIEIEVSRPKLEEARTKLRDLGVELRDDQGTVKHKGLVASYYYDGQKLSVEVLVKPILLSADKIESTIRSWFGDQPASAASRDAGVVPRKEGEK